VRDKVSGRRILGWGLGLGLLAHLLILGAGRTAQAWGQARANPAQEFRIAPMEEELKVQRRRSPRLAQGWVVVLEEGRAETWTCLVKIQRGSGEERREPLKKLRRLVKAKPLVAMVGISREENPVSLARVSRVKKILDVEATAYDPGPVDAKRGFVGTTSLGERAHFGIVAVDPKVIPYRSRLYVEGYGPGLAGDTGGAIKGQRVDLCYNATRQARLYGRRRTKVFVLETPGRKFSAGILKRLGLKPQ
jgi:3D (Asp-Asp-Asp) domain-containing protein